MPCSSTSYVVNIETVALNLLLWYFRILTNTVNTLQFTTDKYGDKYGEIIPPVAVPAWVANKC